MYITSISEFRKRLAALIDQVSDRHEPLVITREGGKPSAVLLSIEDYASLEETRYLLSSPANAKRLAASIRALEAGEGVVKTVENASDLQ